MKKPVNPDSPEDSSIDYIRLVSHQLKSPINAITSLLNTIIDGYAGTVDDRAKYVVEKAVNRSKEAREMITDLMDFERFSEPEALTMIEVDLSDTCGETAVRYSAAASEEGISLHTDFPATFSIFVTGDPVALQHGLKNLIENAIKYTPAHGSISFRLYVDTEKIRL